MSERHHVVLVTTSPFNSRQKPSIIAIEIQWMFGVTVVRQLAQILELFTAKPFRTQKFWGMHGTSEWWRDLLRANYSIDHGIGNFNKVHDVEEKWLKDLRLINNETGCTIIDMRYPDIPSYCIVRTDPHSRPMWDGIEIMEPLDATNYVDMHYGPRNPVSAIHALNEVSRNDFLRDTASIIDRIVSTGSQVLTYADLRKLFPHTLDSVNLARRISGIAGADQRRPRKPPPASSTRAERGIRV